MNKTILVIEDEEEILYSLKDYLELEGYHVVTALNGFEAMQLLEKSAMPNLILLDMKMPIMNGWEFASAFLAKYDHNCPIVITTAAVDAAQRAKDINANDWISKPFDLDSLLEKIKKNES